MSLSGPWLTPPRQPDTGPLIEVHRLRAMQAIDVVAAPAYDPKPNSRPSSFASAVTPAEN